MTPDEIQNAAENLKAAFAAGAISAREFDEGMTDVTKGVKGYTAELNASLNQLGTATKKLGEGLLQGQQGMSQYNDLTASAGDAAAKAAAQFGPLGMAIGAIIKIISFVSMFVPF
jgi:ABC-type transporter Mla subunit MlaD